ncbi:MAG: DUF4136 domain-containing protein [Gemmatimonadales bacterium]
MRPVLGVLMVVALAGCGVPIQSGAHFANAWEPPARATFAWNDSADRTQGDQRLEDNAFLHARLHEAVEWELNLRGIRYSESNPSLLIHHHFSLADHEMEREIVDEAGYESTETIVYEGGSLVLHIVDARTGEDAWVAWAQANVEPALTSPAAMRRWVYDLVTRMFADWPIPPRAAQE